jgi:hypothetical protein
MNVSKFVFGVKEIEFCGHTVNSEGIKPIAEKLQVINDFPKPLTIRQLRRFLGIINFYRCFIPTAAKQLASLNDLLKESKNGKVVVPWNEGAEKVFEEIKLSLAKATMLVHPLSGAPISIAVDASDYAIGSVLQQKIYDYWQPLSFFTKALSSPQRKYSAYDRELLAIYASVKRFKHWIEGHHFTIYTDNKPLTFAFSQKLEKCSPRQFRYLLPSIQGI